MLASHPLYVFYIFGSELNIRAQPYTTIIIIQQGFTLNILPDLLNLPGRPFRQRPLLSIRQRIRGLRCRTPCRSPDKLQCLEELCKELPGVCWPGALPMEQCIPYR
jgi:hypothetical protein